MKSGFLVYLENRKMWDPWGPTSAWKTGLCVSFPSRPPSSRCPARPRLKGPMSVALHHLTGVCSAPELPCGAPVGIHLVTLWWRGPGRAWRGIEGHPRGEDTSSPRKQQPAQAGSALAGVVILTTIRSRFAQERAVQCESRGLRATRPLLHVIGSVNEGRGDSAPNCAGTSCITF